MKESDVKKILTAYIALFLISGCANIPLRDGELVLAKNTTATIDDFGVARVNNQF